MDATKNTRIALSLLTVRLVAGAMLLFGHGLGKVLGFAAIAPAFPDPLGVGSTLSLALAAGAESLGALAVMAGLKTRLAAASVVVTMLVAAVGVHFDEGFGGMELALAYALLFGAVALAGPGRYSIDAALDARRAEVRGVAAETA